MFCLGGSLTPPFAFAQDANQTRLRVEQPAARDARREDGRILIIAFRDGMPEGDVVIEGAFGRLVTRADGTASADLKPGTYRAYVPEIKKQIAFTIRPGQETELSLRLLGQKQGSLTLLEPAPAPAATTAAGPAIELEVKVTSEESGKPIAGANILTAGSEAVASTDDKGVAKIQIGSASDSFSIFHPKFQTRTLTAPNARDGAITVKLKEAVNELEEVVVLAPKIKGSVSALVEVRRQSSAVTDVLGSEQMSRAGDSDAAASLRRVTGLTLMGGKYVYVRGLGERYSGVQMNSFGLPSPEPSRRVVPLDLFPTSILDSVIVQKSYSPDLPGEFGGGVIQLQTKALPEKFFFKASLATTVEDNDNRLTSRSGSTDWLGMDDGGRKLPGPIRAALASGKKLIREQPGTSEGIPEQELVALGQTLPTNYNTTRTSKEQMPGFTISSGNRFNIAGAKLGAAASVLYGQGIDAGRRKNHGYNVGSGSKLEKDFDADSEYAEVETRAAASLDLGLVVKEKHQVGFSSFLLRHTTDFTQQESRVSQSAPSSTLESTTIEWTERELWTKHLKGKHDLSDWLGRPVEVAWRAGRADAKRDSPDRREYAYDRTATSYQMRGDSGGNRRTYSYLTDESKELGLDLSVPLSRTPDKIKLKVGASQLKRERRSDVFRLYFQREWSGAPPVDVGSSPDEQLSPENRKPGVYILQNLTDAADSYSGEQVINAQYAMIDYAPVKTWAFQAGGRSERSEQKVRTFTYYEPSKPFAESTINMKDFLPAYSAVWKPNDSLRARLAYSETLARPDFREMSTVGFIDDESGYTVRGNANLKGTVIKNIDHRWEYYFTSDEYASIGGFYKKFQNPIEVMFEPGVNKIQTFDNAAAAQNYGAEFEGRMGLRHFTRFLRRWSVLYNYTWIQSRVELDERNRGVQTSDKRPLQGQAPYTQNFQLQYDNSKLGLSATMLVNMVGPRITEVGTNKVPDTYEETRKREIKVQDVKFDLPAHQLDFVASKSLAKNFSIALKAQNLLDPVVEARQGGEIVRSYRRGITTGVSINAIF